MNYDDEKRLTKECEEAVDDLYPGEGVKVRVYPGEKKQGGHPQPGYHGEVYRPRAAGIGATNKDARDAYAPEEVLHETFDVTGSLAASKLLKKLHEALAKK